MASKKNEIENFLAELEIDKPESTARFPVRDTLKAERDALYKGYIVEGYTQGIEGNYGISTAVRVIEPTGGRRQTLWLSGYEQDHLVSAVTKGSEDGHNFPLEVTFLRHQEQSKNGRTYNRFSMKITGSGDDVTVPPVPEDQFQD